MCFNYLLNTLFGIENVKTDKAQLAHYITKSFSSSTWKVRIGDRNHASDVDDTNLLILNILSISIHPDYNGVAAYFDVAVIKTKDVTFSEFIRPVCLPRYVVL